MTAPITALLQRIQHGDRRASEELYQLLYADLRSYAGQLMAGQGNHTLQPTAVVHEAWLRLGGGASNGDGAFNSRAHFLSVAAKAMRCVLVDHARSRDREKRGRDSQRVGLDAAVASYNDRNFDLLAVDESLAKLSQFDADLAKLVELRFFGGLTIPETASVLAISTATVERNWRAARAWLMAQLKEHEAD